MKVCSQLTARVRYRRKNNVLYYTGKNGAAHRFAEEMESSGTASAIRGKPGNARYEYFQPLDDAETVLLIGSWTDQAALDAHHASPEMQTIMRLREKYGLTVKAERFMSESVPERDKEFLK